MKYFKWITISILLILALVAGSGIVIVNFYGDKVKEIVVKEINKQLITEANVREIKFSVFKKFPFASLDFTDVTIKSSLNKKDTLFNIQNIFLQFNIIDIFNKKYHIRKIEINNGFFKPFIDKDDRDNFHFWKTTKDSSNTNFSFALDEVILKNIFVNYVNKKNNQSYSFTANKAILKGNFSTKEYDLFSKGELFVDDILINEIHYLRKQKVKMDLILNINNQENSYSINKGKIAVENLNLDVVGKIISTNDETDINLAIKGNEMNIQSLISVLPDKYRKFENDFLSSGNIYFNSTLKGKTSETSNPVFNADFGIDNAKIFYKKSNINLSNVSLKGKYNSRNERIEIKNISSEIGNGKLSGEFQIENFSHPKINFSTVATLDLKELQEFLKIDTLQSLNGNLTVDMSFGGNINNAKNYSVQDFKNATTLGNITLSETSFQFKNNPNEFKNINGKFLFNNNDIIVENLKCSISATDLELKGFFRNIISCFFVENQKLVVDVKLKSNQINLDELLASKTASKSDSIYNLRFSKNVNLYLIIEVDKLNFRKFEAKNINGKIVFKDGKLLADGLNFAAMDGKVALSGIVDGTDENKFLISCDAAINKINIQKLFYEFENFGQQTLEEKHLKGIATAGIQFVSEMNSKLDFDLNKIYTKADLTIEKGELINFEPLKNLSKYIKMEELEDIKFSSLKNEIEIRNQKIFIPKMQVKSSALNIDIAGTHTFNNEIDYRIKLFLNELLAKKARKARRGNEEFGIVEKDEEKKFTLFITMTGTVAHPVFRYDKKGLKEKLQQDVKQEKQTLKQIFKEEFGWFKNDTLLSKKNEPEPTNFQLEWEEYDEKSKIKNQKTEQKSKTKFDKLMDKIAPKNKEEMEEVEE